MYIEKSFDTIFNIGCGGGGRTAPSPMHYGSENSPMHDRVKFIPVSSPLASYYIQGADKRYFLGGPGFVCMSKS